MWGTDICLVQIHVTFSEYLMFQEFKRILYISLATYLGQESIADLFLSRSFIHKRLKY